MTTTIDKYEVRTDLAYDAENHFWVEVNNGIATIGMSPLIQETNGSFVAVQLHPLGSVLNKGQDFGAAEAEKHVGPLKSPLSGKTIETNNNVIENPRLINTNPYDEGWLIKLQLHDEAELDTLIAGEDNIIAWFTSELKKFDEKGWLAQ